MSSNDFDFLRLRNQPVNVVGGGVEIGFMSARANEVLDCGELGYVPVSDLMELADYYQRITDRTCRPQLAALVFDATGDPRALDWYFPITNALNPAEKHAFYEYVAEIIQNPGLDLHVYGPGQTDTTALVKADVIYLVAGHLAEIFFYRRDILEVFLSGPRHFYLYLTPGSFAEHGGLAGGDYDPSKEAIQLVLSRLYEGYYGPTPGVAPFLHEFGHMLDFFEAGRKRMGGSEGLLPGMSPQDGPIFTPRSRQLFVQGKQAEYDRYKTFEDGYARDDSIKPIGHPYVFQNDTEFIAGHLEMFFRNPNYFAAQNPTLYGSFVELFRQDPRRAWAEDFPFYVKENQKAYGPSTPVPWPTRIKVPSA